MKILFLTPPMTQINTPYPATPFLVGFIKNNLKNFKNLQFQQNDLSLELFLKLFSKSGLNKIRKHLLKSSKLSRPSKMFIKYFSQYEKIIEELILFLQGRNQNFAEHINNDLIKQDFFINAAGVSKQLKQLRQNQYLDYALKNYSREDQAKFFASMLIDEIANVIKSDIDSNFGLSKYAEKIAASQSSFDLLDVQLNSQSTNLVERILDELIEETVTAFFGDQRLTGDAKIVVVTAPFPGNVYGAFRIAKKLKKTYPEIKILLGGGYVNTELRSLDDPRVFKYFDFITLDDGERPLLQILKFIEGTNSDRKFLRTFILNDHNKLPFVQYVSDPALHDIPFRQSDGPSYEGLKLESYVSLFEMLNPMHRLWSASRWNKLTIAHGCYWKKCTFCDLSLDYIGRYEPVSADHVFNRMKKLKLETGTEGFHFVDEAAPPVTLRKLSEKIIESSEKFQWWGNIRFDKAFNLETIKLMKQAGCIAVTGGLEVASPRILDLIQKGVSIEQVARVTKDFNDQGIMVHAYLMYGFPSQTIQETVDSLDVVRQLFLNGCIDSAFWHRFSATIHSPVGQNPEKYGIKILANTVKSKNIFASNDLKFQDATGIDHDLLGIGLRKALYNYMLGIGFEEDVRSWFEDTVPKSKIKKNWIQQILAS